MSETLELQKQMATAQSILGSITGVRQQIVQALKDRSIPGGLYMDLMTQTQKIDHTLRGNIKFFEREYQQKGGAFYDPTDRFNRGVRHGN